MVAECVGKLALVHPQTLLPKLQENLSASSGFVRSTVVTALKYTISDQPQPIDGLLHSCIGEFLATIGDPDLVSVCGRITALSDPLFVSRMSGGLLWWLSTLLHTTNPR